MARRMLRGIKQRAEAWRLTGAEPEAGHESGRQATVRTSPSRAGPGRPGGAVDAELPAWHFRGLPTAGIPPAGPPTSADPAVRTFTVAISRG
jgi:hypothetical protein